MKNARNEKILIFRGQMKNKIIENKTKIFSFFYIFKKKLKQCKKRKAFLYS